MKKAFLLAIISGLLVLILVLIVTANLQCFFVQNTTCQPGQARLLGLKNNSDGFNNAHVQNTSSTPYYNYSICCNNTDTSTNTITSCPGNVTVLRLSNGSNAHVELGNYSNASYSITSVCLGTNVTQVICSYPATGTCSTNYTCVLSMVGSEGSNTSNAHIGNCSQYSQKVCCGVINTAPSKPTLSYPSNNNASIFVRRPFFNWTASTDPENNILNYTINITCVSCPAACVASINQTTATNYTPSSALCYNKPYNWTVSACDVFGACNISDMWNFSINGTIGFDLVRNAINFSTLSLSQNNDTTDNSPLPLIGANSGNVIINVTINASALFTRVMNTINYMFEAADNETGSFNSGCSQTTYTPLDNASSKTLFCNLSSDVISSTANNSGKIHINVTVPSDEPGGYKNSTLQLTAITAES